MKNLIDKYIKRIKLDYPEDDKLMIDLQDFYREAQQQALILPVVVRQSEQLCKCTTEEQYRNCSNFKCIRFVEGT